MSKRLKITPEIAARIQAVYGSEISVEDHVAFEAITLNTLPIRQPGSIFHGATVTEVTLTEMAALLQGGAGVPLQVMHQNADLPVGKVFWGEVRRDRMGKPTLYTQFFVSKTETDLIAKIDDGTIDEVSVGFQSKKLTCSKCGFDYLGPEADFMNVFSMTCGNGHEIGVDGVHAKVDGLDTFYEISLVGKGAASGAKILPQTEAAEGALAASATSRALILQLTAHKEPEMPDPVLVNLAELTGLSTELGTARAELAATKTALETANGQVTTLTARVSELEGQLAAAQSAEQPEASEATLSFLKDQYSKLHVALGQAAPTVPEKVEDLIAGIEEAQAKLSSLIPPGGVSRPAVDDAASRPQASTAAFKARK